MLAGDCMLSKLEKRRLGRSLEGGNSLPSPPRSGTCFLGLDYELGLNGKCNCGTEVESRFRQRRLNIRVLGLRKQRWSLCLLYDTPRQSLERFLDLTTPWREASQVINLQDPYFKCRKKWLFSRFLQLFEYILTLVVSSWESVQIAGSGQNSRGRESSATRCTSTGSEKYFSSIFNEETAILEYGRCPLGGFIDAGNGLEWLSLL
ncbi:hypothetical protein HOY80DRAFT_613398 [Tuber brumale]|nr:hypothetical protein HOY80DRAFT_613398 [Tuber brumale]